VSRWIAILLLCSASFAGEDVENALSTLTSPGAELPRRLAAVDRLAELQAARELIEAWSQGGEAVRLAVPVGFHALGVRGLGQALTALGAPDEGIRAGGAVLLGSIGPAARLGVRKLTIALNDDSALVRRHAAQALGEIGAAAEESLSGLVALAMQDKALAPVAIHAMTRITLDVQLRASRTPLPGQIDKTIARGESWLAQQQEDDGSWGSLDRTALIVLALSEGGLRDEFRLPVRRAMRHLVLELARRPRPEPLVLLATEAAWRETRDPLLRILADRQAARVLARAEETPERESWRLLALRGLQWSGQAIDPAVLRSKLPPDPDLLGIVLAPKYDAAAAKATAERMVAEKVVWKSRERQWGPGRIARGTWAIALAGGEAADTYRRLAYPYAVQHRLSVNPQLVKWEAPPGINADPETMTAAVVIALKAISGRYPPRVLPAPKEPKQKMAVSALKGCLKHPDKDLAAYAASMLTLWE
jgi:hypothetical protein